MFFGRFYPGYYNGNVVNYIDLKNQSHYCMILLGENENKESVK